MINVTGSFALAYFATRLQERLPQSSYRRPLLGTGFCGAYTTFSTMQVEILKMLDARPRRARARLRGRQHRRGYLAIWVATALVSRDAGARVSVGVWAAVAVLGGAGAVARFSDRRDRRQRAGRGFPFGTLAINLSGAFVARAAHRAWR